MPSPPPPERKTPSSHNAPIAGNMGGKKRGRDNLHAFIPDSTTRKRKPWLIKNHQKEEKLIPPRITSKVLKEVLLQQKEIQHEDAVKRNDPFSTIVAEDDTEDNDDDDADNLDWFSHAQNQYTHECEEDEKILDAFMSDPQLNLADTVLQKIRDNDKQVQSESRPLPKLDHSITDLYKGVGKFLSKYTTGKLPKAFKRIPSLKHWEDVLYLIEPENWTAASVYQATRIFASNLPDNEAQRFYSLVLLPRVREDIRKNKRLNFSLFQALKKSIYKPKAFNKGILFPLCQSGSCTLREAVIIGSVIQKVSIPSPHPGAVLLKLAEMEYRGTTSPGLALFEKLLLLEASSKSAVLLKLAEMEYRGTTSYFMKLLLDKKYCLAYRVLDGLVAHFMRFMEDTRVMPVIWHQSLLSFVQRYKNELTEENKDNLERLVHVQKHHLVTPEIKRELNNSRNRGEKEDPASINYPAAAIEEDRFNIPDVPMEED